MPPHDVYIEPFLGTGVILRNKLPAQVNIGVERDEGTLAEFLRRFPGFAGAARKALVYLDDGLRFLETYSYSGKELIYCDPPYLLSTRGGRLYYAQEMDDDEHRELLRILRRLPCMVILSGYWSELYATELRGWRTRTFHTIDRGRNVKAEWVWMNFPEPFALHDSRFLGANFRERERIKRKKKRWVNRLMGMAALERFAIFEAISEAKALYEKQNNTVPSVDTDGANCRPSASV